MNGHQTQTNVFAFIELLVQAKLKSKGNMYIFMKCKRDEGGVNGVYSDKNEEKEMKQYATFNNCKITFGRCLW